MSCVCFDRTLWGGKAVPLISNASIGSASEVGTAEGSIISFVFEDGRKSVIEASLVEKYAVRHTTRPTPLQSVDHMHSVDFQSFLDSASDKHVDALERLALDAIILVKGCPLSDASVLEMARAIDREQHTLYGTHWHVVSKPREGPTRNIAYTSEELDLHQDLVYHESMPGLQLLHCQKFDERCTGGNSTFLDVVHAAHLFQQEFPAAFKVMCEVPAAFIKDDWERPVPAQYYYATPHFHADPASGNVVKVYWAPAFDAPLPPHPRMGEYYEAKRLFVQLIERLKTTPLFLEFKLAEGDCVIFHQSRLLHGRRRFSEPEPGSRQLHGAYVNVDAFRNAVVTRMALKGRSLDSLPLFTNGSWR